MTFIITVLQVTDSTPPLQGANVKAVNQTTGTAYTGTTNSLGKTSINAPDGPYVLTVSKAGFITETTEMIYFGDGGGYIMALTPAPPPPPADMKRILFTTILPIIIGWASLKVVK